MCFIVQGHLNSFRLTQVFVISFGNEKKKQDKASLLSVKK